jgi:hypothetical protein
MTINKIIYQSVGADLSRPSPIYRPSVHVSLSGLFCETSLSALGGFSAIQMNNCTPLFPSHAHRSR